MQGNTHTKGGHAGTLGVLHWDSLPAARTGPANSVIPAPNYDGSQRGGERWRLAARYPGQRWRVSLQPASRGEPAAPTNPLLNPPPPALRRPRLPPQAVRKPSPPPTPSQRFP